MKTGTLYGIGVGPGDPGLVTVTAARLIANSPHVVVPKARIKAESVALEIAREYVSSESAIHELVFPMTTDRDELARSWRHAAETIAAFLRAGEDVCFLTLGDSMIYSTYIYLLREMKEVLPEAPIVTVPGITSFCASAALTNFPLGEAKEPITIIPTADDLQAVRDAIATGGTVVLMKIGKRLNDILGILEETGVIDNGVFVQRAGHPGQVIETDLRKLRELGEAAGYLSVILLHTTNPHHS
jgi:precorrin-2/cobalt-factor-2 C20-methyltransferase